MRGKSSLTEPYVLPGVPTCRCKNANAREIGCIPHHIPGRARPCRCEHPMVDVVEQRCVRCGHDTAEAVARRARNRRAA